MEIIISGKSLCHSYFSSQLEIENLIKNNVDRKDLRLCTRASAIGLALCHQALMDADLINTNPYYPPERRGIFLACPNTTTPLEEMFPALKALDESGTDGNFTEKNLPDFFDRCVKRIHPHWLIRGLSNFVLGASCIKYQIKGASMLWADHELSFFHALNEAVSSLKRNEHDMVVVGAYDSMDSNYIRQEYKACGMGEYELNEGGVFLVLEKREAYRARGGVRECQVIDPYLDDRIRKKIDMASWVRGFGFCGVASWPVCVFKD